MPAEIHTEVIVAALALACRAPSIHNSQPWRWVKTDHHVELFADPARLLRAADTTGREALISCGAVLDHFRVAMSAAGWHTSVKRFPDPGDPLHLATVEFTAAAVCDEHTRRADAILLRRTDRLPLSTPPDWPRLAHSLSEHAGSDAVRVDVIADQSRDSVVDASQLAEELHRHDPEYQSELSWWTADFVTSDGIPPSALISAAESGRVVAGRTFPMVGQRERRGEVNDDRSKILVLSTEDTSNENVLRCGEALSTVLLDAAMAGMATCTLTHITEVPAGREIIASLIPGDVIPQVLVRVGRAPALDATAPPTPRRPIEQVLHIVRGQTC